MIHVLLLFKVAFNASRFFQNIGIFIDSKSSQYSRQAEPHEYFNSIDSRWIVGTTVKIWEISSGEEMFWVWLKMADRDIQAFRPLVSCNTLICVLSLLLY